MSNAVVKLHYWVGVLGIVAFLATGLYMHFGLDGLKETADLQRMSYRTCHIYILMMALLNLMVGIYGQAIYARATGWPRRIKFVSSGLFLIVLPMSLYSFFTEAVLAQIERPFAIGAVILVFVASVLALLSEALQG